MFRFYKKGGFTRERTQNVSSLDTISWLACGDPDPALPTVWTSAHLSSHGQFCDKPQGTGTNTQLAQLYQTVSDIVFILKLFASANIIVSGEWSSPNKKLINGNTKSTDNSTHKSSSFQVIVIVLYKCNHNFIRDLYSTGHGINVPTIGVHLSF